MEKDYKSTLNLPKTDFAMKANLDTKEPEQLKKWESIDIYNLILQENSKNQQYILHDGPPYANGEIHMGTALNKILKDIVIKYQSMNSKYAPYIPGWDCHGLPIELQVEKIHGKSMDTLNIINKCRDYASGFVERQKATFKRLGVFGAWDNPYLTMDYKYEASILKEFAKIVEKDAVYSALKPVYWCYDCVTALAEAEVEYKNHVSDSIYVKFKAENNLKEKLKLDKNCELFIVIWTTTPWTIEANLAISMHPDYEYGLYQKEKEIYIIAENLFSKFIKDIKTDELKFTKIATYKGSFFEHHKTEHPYINRDSVIILGEHVTLEAGTGSVHTAPGHGQEDYIVCKKHKIEPYNPVNDYGYYDDTSLNFKGVHIKEANQKIIELLKTNNRLIYNTKLEHSYPHCWRCKKPVIFRATAQWFISMDKTNLRASALKEIEAVAWIPSRGMNRIHSMVAERPDWCISRQRKWGVPIPYFKCKNCSNYIFDYKIIMHLAKLVEKQGIEAWHNNSIEDLLPDTYNKICDKCKSTDLDKSKDILDVWFDSGISHVAVCKENFAWPVDLYLEGSDQHRGWFHTALLSSVLNYNKAPYKKVLTHGFIVDKKGIKMSKSMGNVVSPLDLIKKSGADILRLWVAHENFIDDISYSEEAYTRVTESYRRIRNTFRFILGNIYDFNTDTDKIPYDKLRTIDKWLLAKLMLLIKSIILNYDNFEFYKIFQSINNFCSNELSSLYLDISKDTLYANKAKSTERKAIQTTMHITLSAILKILAPIIPFTTEEAYSFMPDFKEKKPSILLEKIPAYDEALFCEKSLNTWDSIFKIREIVTKELETLRQHKLIGHSLDTDLSLGLDKESFNIFKSLDINIEAIFIVSNLKIYENEKLKIEASKSSFKKCVRCWQYKFEVGTIKDYEELCSRCYLAIN